MFLFASKLKSWSSLRLKSSLRIICLRIDQEAIIDSSERCRRSKSESQISAENQVDSQFSIEALYLFANSCPLN